MATTTPDCQSHATDRDNSVKESLRLLENLLDQAGDSMFDNEFFEEVEKELRLLHARLRSHHASDQLGINEGRLDARPELRDEAKRLQTEHPTIIGMLDRVIRAAESMADRTLEDKEVFILRGREIIAVLRRHEAEEDRLFYHAVWRETGGESGG